jgi:hypothetical protein
MNPINRINRDFARMGGKPCIRKPTSKAALASILRQRAALAKMSEIYGNPDCRRFLA